jgi:hypothetical protein
MNLQKMISEIRDLSNEFTEEKITNKAIIDWINEIYLDLVLRTKILQKEFSFNTVVGKQTYDFFSDLSLFDVLDILRVEINNKKIALLTYNDLDIEKSDWKKDIGEPEYYLLQGLQKILFYPSPDMVYPAYILYVKRPDKLQYDVDTPAIPEEFHKIILYGTLAIVKTKLAQQDFVIYEQKYMKFIDDYKVDLENKLITKPPEKLWTAVSTFDFSGTRTKSWGF